MPRYIDADALVANHIPEACDGSEYAEGWNDAIAKIRNASSIDAAPVVHGEWETVPHKSVEHGFVERDGECERCSNCCHAFKDLKKWFLYCPNCGAKMGVKNDEI